MQHSHLTFFDAGGCLGLAALCQKGESTNIEENFRGLEAGGGGLGCPASMDFPEYRSIYTKLKGKTKLLNRKIV